MADDSAHYLPLAYTLGVAVVKIYNFAIHCGIVWHAYLLSNDSNCDIWDEMVTKSGPEMTLHQLRERAVCGTAADDTFISKMYFSLSESSGLFDRRWSVYLEGSISGENQTLAGHSGRPLEYLRSLMSGTGAPWERL
jgi:hypothetical protein